MQTRSDLAILMTPPGAGAIAVVRLVGPLVGQFLQQHFSRELPKERAVHGRLTDGLQVIDDPVVVLAGEGQIADINLHGGEWVVQATLELARRAGFEIVNSSTAPLHPRAVDAESEIEGEMLLYLPHAKTELALRVLLAQPRAWADFKVTRQESEQILADRSLWWLLHTPRVAIVGAPNVGKSTLANQLFAQERSITADLPGTTRDWVGEIANIDGLAVMLVDTPGQRQTRDPIEVEAIGRSEKEIDSANLVVLVLDASRPFEPEQSPLIARYQQAIRVINKIDHPAAWDVSAVDGVRTIATTGFGLDELRSGIQRHFGCERLEVDRARWWTQRQRELLEQLQRDQKMR